jgi:hypothetical protein
MRLHEQCLRALLVTGAVPSQQHSGEVDRRTRQVRWRADAVARGERVGEVHFGAGVVADQRREDAERRLTGPVSDRLRLMTQMVCA